MNAITPSLLLTVGIVVLSGCTFPSRYPVYKPGQVGQLMRTDTGEVISVRDVVISGNTDTKIGRIGGGAVGVAAATEAGGDPTGHALASAGAGIAGSVVGNAVEEVVTRKAAQEIMIRLKSGEVIAIVRETGKDPMMEGDNVQILMADSGSTTLKRL